MNNLDYIYFQYRLDYIKPKSKFLLFYCFIRKTLTIKERPSNVSLYCDECIKKQYQEMKGTSE
jgi:hypothetical protein